MDTGVDGVAARGRRAMWVRRAPVVAATCLGVSVLVTSPPATGAVPHGCASVSRDYSVAAEPMRRSVEVDVHSNEPCTFTYAEGDTFSGSGRFTVTCSTGGYYHHPDFQDGRYPPVFRVPVPQPCAVDATVTMDGYHQFTGGLVIGGGFTDPPAAPGPRVGQEDFRELCAPGSEPSATVDLQEPVNYSGLLTYTGTVRCDGADIEITSLTVTPLAGAAYPSAGTARCDDCAGPVSVSGTAPAKAWIYEVELQFAVGNDGRTVESTRLGRYVSTWAGMVTTLCPGIRPSGSPDAPTQVHVPAGETCPV
jgi:hypothetical protein